MFPLAEFLGVAALRPMPMAHCLFARLALNMILRRSPGPRVPLCQWLHFIPAPCPHDFMSPLFRLSVVLLPPLCGGLLVLGLSAA
jgi:hypothetical protein